LDGSPVDAPADAILRRLAARFSIRTRSAWREWRSLKADVETRARLGRNEIDRGVADIDRGEFQVRWIEMRGAAVERLGIHGFDQPRDAAYRIVGELRGAWYVPCVCELRFET